MNEKSIFPILLAMVVSIIVAFTSFFLLIYFVEIDLHTQKEYIIFDFYNQSHDGDIFILGSSFVHEGIDANLIEASLHEKNINRSVYNLGVSGDSPLERLPEINDIIASNPKMILIGLSYFSISDTRELNEDRLSLASTRTSINPAYATFYSDEQFKLLTQSSVDRLFYERKYIPQFLYNNVVKSGGPLPKNNRAMIYKMNFKDPWIFSVNLSDSEKKGLLKPSFKYEHPVSDTSNPQKKALIYSIEQFKKHNISVILINMPLNPVYSSYSINETKRKNFADFLNSTDVLWYDYEYMYPSVSFIDLGHLNAAGRQDLSRNLSEVLFNHLTKVE
jgi:hypothetical protein